MIPTLLIFINLQPRIVTRLLISVGAGAAKPTREPCLVPWVMKDYKRNPWLPWIILHCVNLSDSKGDTVTKECAGSPSFRQNSRYLCNMKVIASERHVLGCLPGPSSVGRKIKKRQPRNCFAVESNSVLDPVITSAAQQASGSLEITQDKVYQTKLK